MALFDEYGMSYHITPGISSFQAAAAALKSQFTIPEKVQTIILTREDVPRCPRKLHARAIAEHDVSFSAQVSSTRYNRNYWSTTRHNACSSLL